MLLKGMKLVFNENASLGLPLTFCILLKISSFLETTSKILRKGPGNIRGKNLVSVKTNGRISMASPT